MERVFIPAKSSTPITIPDELKHWQARTGLLTTIQHLHELPSVEHSIPNAVRGGQILGCDVSAARDIEEQVDQFLYIGTGSFHPIAVKMATERPVFTLHPSSGEIHEITQEQVEHIRKRKRAAYTAFLKAKRIGILVSTKPGQAELDRAERLRTRLSDKESYILMGNMLTPAELENFPFIDCFVNTACPRLQEDRFPRPVINHTDLPDETA